MRKFMTIAFASGHVYEVPVAAVADDRTNYYAVQDPGRTREQHAAETAMLFESEFELFDWAKDNMNWSDLQKHARLVGFRPSDFAAQWNDAMLDTADEPATPIAFDSLGDEAPQAPLALALSEAASQGAYCRVHGFTADGKNINHAIVALIGGPEIVHGYIAVLQNYDDFVRTTVNQPAGH